MSDNTKELSIIIVSYNTSALLRGCLRSIHETISEIAFEIIVVDNASNDGSQDMVTREFSHVTLIKNASNVGFAAANNQGIRQARGATVLLLNSDTEVRPGALTHCMDFLRQYSKAGVVGCKLLNADGSIQVSCESFLTLRYLVFENFFLEKIFPHSSLFSGRSLSYFKYDHVQTVDYVKGAFLLIRRRVIDDIGLLDEKFFFYAEEMDWCYRAWRYGWQVYFTPGAEVLHYGGQSSDPVSPTIFVQLHRARYQFYRKHHSVLSSVVARFVMLGGAALRTCIWSLIVLCRYLFANAKVEAARKKLTASSAALFWLLKFKRE